MMKKSDPIVMEVINNRLQSIANEMEDSLLKMAFSVIVKEMKDASTYLMQRDEPSHNQRLCRAN